MTDISQPGHMLLHRRARRLHWSLAIQRCASAIYRRGTPRAAGFTMAHFSSQPLLLLPQCDLSTAMRCLQPTCHPHSLTMNAADALRLQRSTTDQLSFLSCSLDHQTPRRSLVSRTGLRPIPQLSFKHRLTRARALVSRTQPALSRDR